MQSIISTIVRVARRVSVGALVAFAFVAPLPGSAQTVNFESLAYGGPCNWNGGPALDSYAGFHWGGIIALDLNNLQSTCHRNYSTGYVNLQPVKVGEVVGLGSGGAWLSRDHTFVLKSLVAGAGWINTTNLKLSFYLNTVLQGTSTLTLDVYQTGGSPYTNLFAGAADFIGFTPDYVGSDIFNSAAESCPQPIGNCVPRRYESYFLDNLVFEDGPIKQADLVTPEPATLGLMAFGMLAIAAAGRTRRQR